MIVYNTDNSDSSIPGSIISNDNSDFFRKEVQSCRFKSGTSKMELNVNAHMA